MTDRINEALAYMEELDERAAFSPYAEEVEVVIDAARAYVQDWITCPTCDGSGQTMEKTMKDGVWTVNTPPCPDCVDGLIPSPKLIERGASVIAVESGFDSDSTTMKDRRLAKAVLLASRRGETK